MSDSIGRKNWARGESWPHRLACWTAGATLFLLLVGGLVTTHGAGLAVPDWPTTFGHNMFFFPWSEMVGGVFYEHSHRLVASGVGLLTIALAFALWWKERRAWLRWLGAGALGLVIVQGVLGGLRVIWLQETLAIVHACLAQLFFALVVALAFFTSTEWAEESPRARLPDALRVRRLALVTTALIYLQAIAGAILRHTGAGLELHLLLAAAVAGHAALLAYRVLPVPTAPRGVRRCAAALTALLLVQVGLGLGAYWVRFVAAPAPAVMVFFTTAHVVGGAALLAAAVALSLRSYRCIEGSEMTEGESIAGRRVSA